MEWRVFKTFPLIFCSVLPLPPLECCNEELLPWLERASIPTAPPPPSAINGESADRFAPIKDEDDLNQREMERQMNRWRERRLWSLTSWGPSSVYLHRYEPWMDNLHFCTNKHHHELLTMLTIMKSQTKASESRNKTKKDLPVWPESSPPTPPHPLLFFREFSKKEKKHNVKKENEKL